MDQQIANIRTRDGSPPKEPEPDVESNDPEPIQTQVLKPDLTEARLQAYIDRLEDE